MEHDETAAHLPYCDVSTSEGCVVDVVQQQPLIHIAGCDVKGVH